MNQFFSLQRFSLLVAKHWADNKRRYTLSIVAFIVLLVAWFLFTILIDSRKPMEKEIQLLTYFFALFGAGTFYASQYFRDLGSRAKGINFLLVPASAFEKILCSLLFTVVLFFILFTAAFYLVDFLMVTVANKLVVPDDALKQQNVLNVFKAGMLPFDGQSTINVMLIFFAIHSAFLLGSVYFEKFSFLKTIITGFAVFFIFFCLVYFLYEKVMPKGDYDRGFLTSFRVDTEGADDHIVQIPGWIGNLLRYILMYAIAPFLWLVTYYRLKEKQV